MSDQTLSQADACAPDADACAPDAALEDPSPIAPEYCVPHVPVEMRDMSQYIPLKEVIVPNIQLKLFVPKQKVKTEEDKASEKEALKKLKKLAKEAKSRGEKFVPPAEKKESGPKIFVDYVRNGRRGPLKVKTSGYQFVPYDPSNAYEAVLFDPDEHCTLALQFDPAVDQEEVAVLQAIQQKIISFASKHSKVFFNGEEKNEAETANLMYPLLTPSKMGTEECPLYNVKLHVYPTKPIFQNRKKVGEEPAIEVLNVTSEFPDGTMECQIGDMSTVPKKSEVKAFFAIRSVGVFANRLFVTNVADSLLARPPRVSDVSSEKTSLVDMLRENGQQVRLSSTPIALPKVGDDDDDNDDDDSNDGDSGAGGGGSAPPTKRPRK
jgi:hypothetical protein